MQPGALSSGETASRPLNLQAGTETGVFVDAGIEPVLIRKKTTPVPPKPSAADALNGYVGPQTIALIQPSPYQPRKEFPAEEIKALAESLRLHGLLQPIVVRHNDEGDVELVAGERRLRAAKFLGWQTIGAKRIEVSNEEAAELVVLENLQRKDLNAVERAQAYQRLLDRPGATQQAVAERLGISQPVIANALAMLKLPAEWQKRIISQEITPTQARALAPWRDRAEILKAVAKDLPKREAGDTEPLLSAEDFEDAIGTAVRRHSHEIKGGGWCEAVKRHVSFFKPTAQQRAELDIVTLPDWNGKPVERAMNVKLWEKLQTAHAKALPANEKPGHGNARGSAKAKPKELTPAEQKLRAAELAEQLVRRREEWATNWKRRLLFDVVGDCRQMAPHDLYRLLLMATCAWQRGWENASLLVEAVLEANKLGIGSGPTDEDAVWWMLVGVDNGEVVDVLLKFLPRLFWEFPDPEDVSPEVAAAGEPCTTVPGDDVTAIARWLGVDLAAAWKSGPGAIEWRRSYWELHSKEQLQAVAKAAKLNAPGVRKVDLVETLGRVIVDLPKELAERAPAKAKKARPR